MKLNIRWRVFPNALGRLDSISVPALKRRSIALRRKAGKPHTGFCPRATADRRSRDCLQLDAQDFADLAKVVDDRLMPVIVKTFAPPVTRPLFGRLNQFVDRVDMCSDHLSHDAQASIWKFVGN
jgi:hypothetical protein